MIDLDLDALDAECNAFGYIDSHRVRLLIARLRRAEARAERLEKALRKIRGWDDPWSHRGHESSEAGHECRVCWIMKETAIALASDGTEDKP